MRVFKPRRGGQFQPAALAAGGCLGGMRGGRGVKTPALDMITPLGLKTEYTVRHLPSSPEGVATFSPLL
ncbi:MAG: hypothetical protein HS103_06630 [Anaerolineales bacterium]|nr:hypothetical protein [Anaerolineales bacterium]